MNPRLVRPALFASTADATVLRDRARLLPYDRDSLAPGAVLPLRDEPFLRTLLAARSIHFDGSETHLGDALLGLSVLEAMRDAASLFGLQLPVTASPEIARLLGLPALPRTPERALSISVVQGCSGQFMPSADLPPVRTATRVYADLPSRRYLDVERRLGLRLPRNQNFLPALRGRPAAARARPFICYIAATSWPEKKHYGTGRFARVATRIDELAHGAFDHVLVEGLDEDPHDTPAPLRALPPDLYDLEALLGLFAQATLIIGNDTGLVHAAAMTTSDVRRGVIGIYGRHSYLRFTTGDPRHYAIATPFAQAMAFTDGSPVRDGIDDDRYPRAATIRRLAPELIANYALQVLGEND
jgi:hypothetical protein